MGHYSGNTPSTSDLHSTFDRVRVDPAQTSFWEGREFRTFYELSIPTLQTVVIKAVVPLDIVLFGLKASIELGLLRIATVVGGTEGGDFSTPLPIIPANTMTDPKNRRKTYGVGGDAFYVPVLTLAAGGTHTGGTELDILRLKTTGNLQQASSVGDATSDERGVGAGTYYFRLFNSSNDTVTGVFKARWEERA